VLTTVTATTEYRAQRTSRSQPPVQLGAGEAGSEVRTENNSTTFAPSVTLGWAGGLVTSFRYTTAQGEAVTSGNITESNRRDWGATANVSFRPPRSLIPLRNRIQTALSFSSSMFAVCLIRVGSDECRTVSDSRRQQADLRLDTGFSPTVRGGLSFSYIVTDQRHTSQKLSQIVFTVFGDLTLTAGRLR
jgi:hypothetical protein